jgi:hypothetical protein
MQGERCEDADERARAGARALGSELRFESSLHSGGEQSCARGEFECVVWGGFQWVGAERKEAENSVKIRARGEARERGRN